MPTDRLLFDVCQERDEARAEVARLKELHEKADLDRWNALDEVDVLRTQIKALKELVHQHAEKAVGFQQAAEDWRYIAKQYQAALKKEA